MEISLWLGAAGARRAARRGGVVVVIDSLRMSSTVVVALASGMRAVVPVRSVEECVAAPGITAGERGGERLPGCRHGNSPLEIAGQRYQGETLYLTTTNGTRCLEAARLGGARTVLVGCLLNAGAVARLVAELAAVEGAAALVTAGRRGAEAVEDTLTATEIGRRLPDCRFAGPLEPVWSRDFQADFLASASGRRLARLGYRQDVELCARCDLFDLVPVVREGELVPYRILPREPERV